MSSHDPIKVYDARWEVGEFTDAQVRRLLQSSLAYGRLVGADTVVLTRDGRLGAGQVLQIGLETAMEMGFRVFLCPEPISTPQSYFAALMVSRQHSGTMGLGITASHNPKQYVGVKFTVPVVKAIGLDCGPLGGLSKIREIYHSPERFTPRAGGQLHLLHVEREYIDYSLREAGVGPGDLKGLRVVLDSFHGSAGPELFRALSLAGVEVIARRLVPDGNFPSGSPNPTSQGKMDPAVRLAADLSCHAVVGIDGDGDRIVFGDGRGILTAGFAFIPILRQILERERVACPAPVLYDPKVSPLALAEWGRLNTRPVLFRNGHSQIKDYMNRIQAIAGAEESGHYYHRMTLDGLTISAENSILTVSLFLAAVKRQPGLLDELCSLQSRVFTTGEFNYQFDSDATRDQAMAAVIESLKNEGATTVTTTPDGIDLQGTCVSWGVKLEPGHIQLEEGWYSGYLRIATNEKSVVRSYFSAGDGHSGRRVEELARRILSEQFGGKVID